MTIQLLTKYILAPIWVRLLIFLLFYFLIIKLHYFDADLSLVECMQGSKSKAKKSKTIISEILLEQKGTTLLQEEEIEHLTREQKEMRLKELQDLHNMSCELRQPMPISNEDLQNQIFDLRESILNSEPKGPILKTIESHMESLPRTEQDPRSKSQRLIDPVKEVQNLRHRLYGVGGLNISLLSRDSMGLLSLISQACDKAFIDIENTLQQDLQTTETSFTPLLAESKNSILKEVEERIQEQISFVNTRIDALQNSNLITESISQRQNALADVLKKTFNHKIEQLRMETKDEISSLWTQNQELQNVVNIQVAEIKSQKELIEQMRKSFERKLQAKDLMLQDLQQKNEQLINQVNRLERTFDRDIRNLQRDMDRILSERTASKIDDLHTLGVPSAPLK